MSTALTKFSFSFFAMLLLIMLVPYVASCHFIMKHQLNSDFSVFYNSSQKILQQDYGNIYSKKATTPFRFIIKTNTTITPKTANLSANLAPPIFNWLISPLSQFSYAQAFMLYSIVSSLFAAYALYILYKTYYQKPPLFLLMLGVALSASLPAYQALASGQVSFILLGLTLTGWAQGRQQHDVKAGLALGIALTLKYFVGLFFITFLLTKRWKIVVTMLLTFLTLNGLSLLLLGPEPFLHYLGNLKAIDWYSSNTNGSLLGWIVRVAYPTVTFPHLHTTLLLQFAYLVFGICGLALLVWFTPPRFNHDPKYWDLGFAMTLVLMLLLSPLGWTYYFPLLILPLMLLIRFILQTDYPPIPTFLTSLAIFFGTYPEDYIRIRDLGTTFLNALGPYSIYCYSLLILCGLMCYLYHQTQHNLIPEPQSPPTTQPEWPLIFLFIIANAPGINAIFATTLMFK